MAAGIIESVVKLQMASNIPEDVAVNTFHAELSDTSSQSILADWHASLSLFYTAATPPQTNALSTYISAYVNRGTSCTISHYRIGDPKPRAPVYVGSLTLGAASVNTSLPFEVAVCGSFRAAPISGIPAGRLRNRIYLGPLTTGAMTSTASLPSRPTTVLQGDLARAFAGLFARNTADFAWCGYSGVAQLGWVPDIAWVDNEFDTQRRRGQSSTSRFQVTV